MATDVLVPGEAFAAHLKRHAKGGGGRGSSSGREVEKKKIVNVPLQIMIQNVH